MNMITIEDFGDFEQVVMGWDPGIKGYFFTALNFELMIIL